MMKKKVFIGIFFLSFIIMTSMAQAIEITVSEGNKQIVVPQASMMILLALVSIIVLIGLRERLGKANQPAEVRKRRKRLMPY